MINFTDKQWEHIQIIYKKWWNHEIQRAVLFVSTKNEACNCNKPKLTVSVSQAQFGDLFITTDILAERIVYDIENNVYEAEGYPMCNMDFTGPGIVAAYLGADISLSSQGMIWFHPVKNRPDIQKLHLVFDENNFWYRRTVEIIRKVKLLSHGNMVLGFPDLGGVMDILSSFFPSEELFFHMSDYPEEIDRLILEIEAAWFTIYDKLYAEFDGFKGYSNWSFIYSNRKSYIHQCDFSFMIGPKDFDTFVFPTLKREFSFISDSIYHLDGSGEVKHLDKLLACANLQAVQWVPGDGNGTPDEYPELLGKILLSGKGTQLFGNYNTLMNIHKAISTLRGVFIKYEKLPKEEISTTLLELKKLR